MTDIGTCLAEASAQLAAAGIPRARHEARLLLAHATGLEQATLIGYPERDVQELPAFQRLVDRRAAREPLSHILGRREFWGLEFSVSPATLDPRADSETVIEAALERITERSAAIRIADLGTGTGCLLAALLSELPNATGVAVDRSPAAASVAQRNLQACGYGDRATIIVGEWGEALSGRFDLVVVNPPYIPSKEIGLLEPEVAGFEPRLALDGGQDGLSAFRRIAEFLPALLSEPGMAVLEFGAGQAEQVAGLLTASGLQILDMRLDLGGRKRCVVCQPAAR